MPTAAATTCQSMSRSTAAAPASTATRRKALGGVTRPVVRLAGRHSVRRSLACDENFWQSGCLALGKGQV